MANYTSIFKLPTGGYAEILSGGTLGLLNERDVTGRGLALNEITTLDPTKLSLKQGTSASGTPGYIIDAIGDQGNILVPNMETAKLLGFNDQQIQGLTSGAPVYSQEFDKYLQETGQTYNNGQFSGSASVPNPTTTFNPYAQTGATQSPTGTTQATQTQQLPAGVKMFQVDGKAYYSPSGSGQDAVEFNPQQYGIDINSLGRGIANATVYGQGATGGSTGGLDYNKELVNAGVDPFNLDSKSPDQLSGVLAQLQKQFSGPQTSYVDILNQSLSQAGIPDLQSRLAKIDELINSTQNRYRQGANAIEGQTIPMPFIQGQQAGLERQRQAELANLIGQQRNIQDQLARAQQMAGQYAEARGMDVKAAQDAPLKQLQYLEALYGIKDAEQAFQKNQIELQQLQKEASQPALSYAAKQQIDTLYNLIQAHPDAGILSTDSLDQATKKIAGMVTTKSDLPASAQEYEYAKSQGYTGTFLQYQQYKARQYGTESSGGSGGTTDQQKRDEAFEKYVRELTLKIYAGTYNREQAVAQLRTLYPDYDENVIYDMVPDNYTSSSDNPFK